MREREIFLQALEKSSSERAKFLESACGGDRALRQRLEDLLYEQENMGGFLETPALTGTRKVSGAGGPGPHGTELIEVVTEKAGDKIGRYKLLQKIGEGGCGVVYMAEQEEPVRRRVALKVIKLGMDTKSVIARFEAERQALAMMDHSNIAKVFDAGATATGRPYFVMELVRGIRITDYCDQNNLKNEERLALFIQVCHAIQHAHQKGIIHRDIKPSNILVTLHDGVPVPKVIDFGIAKATEQRLTEKTLFTEFQSFIGTPAYTSPEQAEMSGLDIDTRSDIYSLGVLLYELLTGATPFDPEHLLRSGLDEMRRIIREEEPMRPSTRLSSLNMSDATALSQSRQSKMPVLMQAVRGDLDWIAMKCLEKDRTRRYATTNDLAEDIQRYLSNEPVLARPPSNIYRLQKLLRRNRGAVAATAAIAAILVFGAGISTWLAVRATRAERDAHTAQQLEAQLRRQAEQEKSLARLNEYVADINLAQQSLAAGNYGRAVQLLNKHLRRPGEQDLRGFEWRYLWQVSRGDEHASLPTQEKSVYSIAISPSGGIGAVGLRESVSIWNLQTHTLITNLAKGGISLAFLPDGKRLIASSPSTLRVWNTQDWTEEKSFPDSAGSIALSSDGRRMVTYRGDFRRGREAIVWDTSTWKVMHSLPGVHEPMALSPDGQALVASTSTNIAVWTVDGSRPAVLLHDSTNLNVGGPRFFRDDRTLTFSPDGKSVVAARNTLSSRGVFVLSIWDALTGEERGVMPSDAEHIEHAGTITSLAFSPDGRTLATASMDHSIRLWDFQKRQTIGAIQGHLSEVMLLAFSPDGKTIVSAAKDGEIKIWPSTRQPKEDVIAGIRHPLGISSDGRILAGQTRDNTAVIFLDLTTGQPEQRFELETNREPRDGRRGGGPPGRVGSPFGMLAAVSANLRTLVHTHEGGSLKIWNTQTRESTILEDPSGPNELVALSPDGRTLITRGRAWQLRRWDLLHGTNSVWLADDAARVFFSPDGRTLATYGRSSAVQLWDAASLAPRTKLECDEQPTTGFFGVATAFSPDSRMLAIAYADDSIRLWDVATGALTGTCTGHKQGIKSVAFSPDGQTLATTSDDSTLKLWNVATQQELLSIRHLGTTLTGLMFSPDGRILLGGSGALGANGGLRFYRAATFSDTDRASEQASTKP